MDMAILHEIHRTGKICDSGGREVSVTRTSIDRRESEFLANLIAADPTIRRTLEIGCAYGVASLSICQAIAGRANVHHTILDPFQTATWKRMGVLALERAGCNFFELREEPSETALPLMLKDQAGQFDLIFVDGCHSFDHVMLDLFYATRLVRVGGYVVLDDTNWPSIAKVMGYYLNYPAYRLWGRSASRTSFGEKYKQLLWKLFPPAVAGWLLPRAVYDRFYARQLFTGMAALQKVAPDERQNGWFASF